MDKNKQAPTFGQQAYLDDLRDHTEDSYPYKIVCYIFKQVGFREPEKHPKFVECIQEVSNIFGKVIKEQLK